MKLINYLFGFALSLSFIGCAKTETFDNTDTKVGISKVTYFPIFTMKGDRYSSIVKGGTYTEAGVTATEQGKDIPVTITGQVNANTPGVYDLTYSATNKDNFSSSITRTVAVLPEAEQAGVDISGKYAYKANSSYTSAIQKLAPGFYVTDNVWGATTIPSYIITTDGKTLILPLNTLSGYGPVQGTGTLDNAGNLTYKVDLLQYGFTGITRNWKKQ